MADQQIKITPEDIGPATIGFQKAMETLKSLLGGTIVAPSDRPSLKPELEAVCIAVESGEIYTAYLVAVDRKCREETIEILRSVWKEALRYVLKSLPTLQDIPTAHIHLGRLILFSPLLFLSLMINAT